MREKEQTIHVGLESNVNDMWARIKKTLENSDESKLYTETVDSVFMQIQAIIIYELAKKNNCVNETECSTEYTRSGLSEKFRKLWTETVDLAYEGKSPKVGAWVVYLISKHRENEALEFLLKRLL